jgi:carbon-monoxide dehydrogenase large subunit
MIDEAARVSGIDRVTLRRRNLIKPEAMPYHTPTHHNYDSGEFERLMDQCLKLADWDGFESRRKTSAANGKLRGRAVTPYIELGGVFNERMELRFDPSGMVSIIAGTHSHGQGHATAFAQLVSDWLGVPLDAIRYIQGDTEKVAIGRGTFAARSSMVGGVALRFAADGIIAKAKPMAGTLMEAAVEDIEFKDGNFTVVGTDKAIPLIAVAKAFYAPAGPVLKFGLGLDAAGSYSGAPGGAPNYPNGCQTCEVEIDSETGLVTIERFAAVDDLGMIINPMICEGQIQGGIAQGLGQALLESVAYDSQSGQLLSGSFMDYGMPRAENIPEIVSALEQIPAKTNPLGIKGIGESGTIGAPPTIVNAVLDALRPLGVTHIDMPVTPLRVWQAIQDAKRSAAA